MAEVSESLQQLGMWACPVCGSAESLGMSPFPVLIVDGEFPPGADDLPPGEGRDGDLTLAIRVECTTCGHLMLFNAERYRTADEKIIVPGLTMEERTRREQ
jgi:DNA-directed RNA polymerase subunit RPC12/RpoP